MTTRGFFTAVGLFTFTLTAQAALQSQLTEFGARNAEVIELKNDGFVETGGQAYVQMGFIKGEMAGVWVKVPASVPLFHVDYFRVLVGNGQERSSQRFQSFFQMGVAPDGKYTAAIPKDIENAVELTPGPYWNDIPAEGARGKLGCAPAGALIGAALEFTHDGLPSVHRDGDGLANALANTLFAIPGGWNYSSAFGLRGDWILRIVGHVASASECQ